MYDNGRGVPKDYVQAVKTIIYHNGDKYVGQFQDDKRTGQGTLTWANGDKYVGQFQDDKLNGEGTLTWANGDEYVGEFKDGKPNGQGTVYRSDGSVSQSGTWSNGQLIGQFSFFIYITVLGILLIGIWAVLYWLIPVFPSATLPPKDKVNDSQASEQSSQTAAEPPSSGHSGTATDPDKDLIADLHRQITRLHATQNILIEQRDAYQQQLLLAEERLRKQTNSAPEKVDSRYSTLKTFLARRFHPDQAPGSGFEKLVRTEIFKEIWEEIGRLDSAQ
jgi:hypothetical protein